MRYKILLFLIITSSLVFAGGWGFEWESIPSGVGKDRSLVGGPGFEEYNFEMDFGLEHSKATLQQSLDFSIYSRPMRNRWYLNIPFYYTTKTNDFKNYAMINGIGDISGYIEKQLFAGYLSTVILGCEISFPTRSYEVLRFPSGNEEPRVPNDFQIGQGIAHISLYSGLLTYTRWRLLFYHEVRLDLPFTGKFFDQFHGAEIAKQLNNEKWIEFAGKNAIGDRVSPGLQLLIAGKLTKMRHPCDPSAGIRMFFPFGTNYRHGSIIGTNYPDSSHVAWNVEVYHCFDFRLHKKENYPRTVFSSIPITITLPLHDRPGPDNNLWDKPDWKSFGREWRIKIGIRSDL